MEGEVKKTKEASKMDEKAAKAVTKMNKMLAEGLCNYCSKTKKCKMFEQYGPAGPFQRCADWAEK